MKIKYIIFTISVLLISNRSNNHNVLCAESLNNSDQVTVKRLIDSNLETSYFTFTGYDRELHKNDKILYAMFNKFSDDEKIDLLFEGQLAHPFHWFDHEDKYLPIHGRLYFIPKIILRMFHENSAPVKTPSFMPRVIYFFWFGSSKNDSTVSPNSNLFYYSIMLSHHSNGQSGEFYNTDGSLNTESGSFSTNYIEFSAYQIWGIKHLPHSTSLSLIWHPGFNRSEELDNQYEELKLTLKFRIDNNILFRLLGLEKNKLFISGSYVLKGRDYIIAPDVNFPSIIKQKADWKDNIFISINLIQNISIFDEVNFFLKYNYGYDYYNINFREKINRIDIGFSAEPSNFSKLK